MTNLLSLLALLPFAHTNPVNLCTWIHAEETTISAYQIPVLAATPGPGHIDQFHFIATERYRQSPYSPTVRLAIYTSLLDWQDKGASPSQVTPYFFREYTTNNGLRVIQINGEELSDKCATNVYLISCPVNLKVPSATWAAVWFPRLGNWGIPPYQPPVGQSVIVKAYQSCRFTKPSGSMGYYFKPLYEVGGCDRATGYTGYFSVPYWITFQPTLSISRSGSSAESLQVSWETNQTNVVLRSVEHIYATGTNTVQIKADKALEIFWLEEMP